MKKKCRCYINLKYYAKVIKTGTGTLEGYKPCPIHEPKEYSEYLKNKGGNGK